MPIIYHVTTAAEWRTVEEQARQTGQVAFYESASLKTEGFIHCSEAHQVAGVLERYFSEQTELVKLVIDTDKLTSRYIQEWSPSVHDTFPHIYGPINSDAVIEIVAL